MSAAASSPVLNRLVALLRGSSGEASQQARALARSAVAVGAVAAGRVAQRRAVPAPETLPLPLAGEEQSLVLHEGTMRLVVRPGTDVSRPPVVLLPPLTPVSSAAELAPLFDALARDTGRTLVAADWLGFGRSDRPNVRYQSGLYQRHLRRLLTAHVSRAADLVAVGHAAEIAAAVAFAAPGSVRRLVLVAPSGMERGGLTAATFGRMLLGLVGGTGAFDLAFRARLATREAIRRYYADGVFLPGTAVPDALVDYAARSVRARGAAFAPRRLAEGLLSMDEHALGAYLNVRVPTLIVLPTLTDAVAPHYDALADLARANDALRVARAAGGWLPHADDPDAVAALVAAFLDGDPDGAVSGEPPAVRMHPKRFRR
ncbi:MAG: alpha/beta hydrolase [Rhodothermales bacterium]|nr:alpha/beta hydrolase [Rhodothermales bacterium]